LLGNPTTLNSNIIVLLEVDRGLLFAKNIKKFPSRSPRYHVARRDPREALAKFN